MANCVFKGPKGDPGQPGKNGLKGDKGDRGNKGDKGSKGDKGDKGDKGNKGDKGDKGDKGSKGDKGDKGDKGSKGDKGDRGKDGKNGKDGKDGKDGRNGKDGKDGKDGGRGPQGEKGDSFDSKPINCGLSLAFNPTSCILTATMKVDKCSISTSVSMLCNIQRIIDEIQNTSRAISLQASKNHTQTISKSQEILNEILKLDFDCDNGLTQILPTLNLINNNVSANLNLVNQINPRIDIVNTNVIDVKSTVITANQNILSVKTDLSLVSQKVINLINSVSQISISINSLILSVSNIQSTVNGINLSISNLNNLVTNIQANLNLVLNVTNTMSANINLILDLSTIINNNTNSVLTCCETIKNKCFGGGGNSDDPLAGAKFIDIICIDCTDPNGPDCPPDATPQEKKRGYREIEITISNLMEALELINDQVALLQRKICPDDDQDCMVLLPDPSLPLTTRGHYLLFSWVLEENPKVSVYQNHTQLRNPIDALRIAGNYWNQYFEPIYKIIGKQYGTYHSEENNGEPLIKGWFFDIAEANRFFNQMRTLTKDTPKNEGNPRFPVVTNAVVPIVNVGKKLILRKVCYGFYKEGSFTKVHSWHRPKNG